MIHKTAKLSIEATFSQVVFKVSNFLSRIKTWFLFPSPSVDFCHQLILLLGARSGKGLGICCSHCLKITGKLKEKGQFVFNETFHCPLHCSLARAVFFFPKELTKNICITAFEG